MASVRQYHSPTTIADALQLMEDRALNHAILAGGTQLIGELETGQAPELDGVIDLRQLGLDELYIENNQLILGAMATLSDVIAHEAASDLAGGILLRAARGEGPLNFLNAATVGGVVASARPDSEFYAALLALDASATLTDSTGISTLSLDNLVVHGGLITSVSIPLRTARSGLARVARTPSDRPIVAAIAIIGDESERVSLCGVADRPVLNGSLFDPPDDFKGSAEYRRKMAIIMVERARNEARGRQ